MTHETLPADDSELANIFADVASVSSRQACVLIPCGPTRLNQLINDRELESFLDGKSRRITVRSIKARRDRLLAQGNKNKPSENPNQPPRHNGMLPAPRGDRRKKREPDQHQEGAGA